MKYFKNILRNLFSGNKRCSFVDSKTGKRCTDEATSHTNIYLDENLHGKNQHLPMNICYKHMIFGGRYVAFRNYQDLVKKGYFEYEKIDSLE